LFAPKFRTEKLSLFHEEYKLRVTTLSRVYIENKYTKSKNTTHPKKDKRKKMLHMHFNTNGTQCNTLESPTITTEAKNFTTIE